MLMVEPDTNGQISNRYGQAQAYYPQVGDTAAGNLSPFFADSLSNKVGTTTAYAFKHARYDLVGIGIDRFRRAIQPFEGNNSWWEPASNYRFNGESQPPRPLNSEYASWTVPCFVPGCTQFIVEFAGDFVSQEDNGAVRLGDAGLPLGPDGRTDFMVADGVRRTRWYGYPRDEDDNAVVSPQSDVVPFSTFVKVYSGGFVPPRWERQVPQISNSMTGDAAYTVAWGPDTQGMPRPSMLRFVMTIDDANATTARIGAGQTVEYVVEVK